MKRCGLMVALLMLVCPIAEAGCGSWIRNQHTTVFESENHGEVHVEPTLLSPTHSPRSVLVISLLITGTGVTIEDEGSTFVTPITTQTSANGSLVHYTAYVDPGAIVPAGTLDGPTFDCGGAEVCSGYATVFEVTNVDTVDISAGATRTGAGHYEIYSEFESGAQIFDVNILGIGAGYCATPALSTGWALADFERCDGDGTFDVDASYLIVHKFFPMATGFAPQEFEVTGAADSLQFTGVSIAFGQTSCSTLIVSD